ncbi:MAG: hypothetical protein ACK5B9_00185 [Flavobacteriia bacterium]|jgi:hypothetical protein
MTKFYSLLFVFFLSSCLFSQQNLVYKGKIGSYPTQLTVDSCNSQTGAFYGKYNYEKKKSFLLLSGELSSPVLYLEEKSKDITTGFWYLTIEDDSIVGDWVNLDNNKKYPVKLKYSKGNKKILNQKTDSDYNKEVSENISGTYKSTINFINDMWVDDDNLSPEIGFNGGSIIIKEIDKYSISFSVEMICGPTYHFAMAEGIAFIEGDHYIYKNEDGCEITFAFKNKTIIAKANDSMNCGFGARAYLDHELLKVKD